MYYIYCISLIGSASKLFFEEFVLDILVIEVKFIWCMCLGLQWVCGFCCVLIIFCVVYGSCQKYDFCLVFNEGGEIRYVLYLQKLCIMKIFILII